MLLSLVERSACATASTAWVLRIGGLGFTADVVRLVSCPRHGSAQDSADRKSAARLANQACTSSSIWRTFA